MVVLAVSSLSGVPVCGIRKLARTHILVPEITILGDLRYGSMPRKDGEVPGSAIVRGRRCVLASVTVASRHAHSVAVRCASKILTSVHFSNPPFSSVAGLVPTAVRADHLASVLVIEPGWRTHENGIGLPHDRYYRTSADSHDEPVVARNGIMQCVSFHCEV